VALSKVGICNLALTHSGINAFIVSLTEQSAEAEACNMFFDQALRKALAKKDWSFARSRVSLTLESGTAPDEWSYQYQIPTGMIKARWIADTLKVRRSDQRIPFRLERIGGSRLLLTDMEDAELVYTAEITDPNQYTAAFVDYLALVLAEYIVFPLTGSRDKLKDIAILARTTLSEAAADDLEAEQEPEAPDSEFVSVRE
jgi:hypothetical protein